MYYIQRKLVKMNEWRNEEMKRKGFVCHCSVWEKEMISQNIKRHDILENLKKCHIKWDHTKNLYVLTWICIHAFIFFFLIYWFERRKFQTYYVADWLTNESHTHSIVILIQVFFGFFLRFVIFLCTPRVTVQN